MNQKKIAEALANCIPFDDLANETLAEYASTCQIETFKRKETIFFEGEYRKYGYYVLSGRVSLHKSSPNGKQLTLAVLQAYDPFALVAVIERRSLPLTATALSDCTTLKVPLATLDQLLATYPQSNARLLTLVGARLRGSHELARALAHDRVEVRLAAVFLMLSANNTKAVKDIEITRQELADLCGTTLETVVRSTKLLERRGVLAFPAHGIVRIASPKELLELAQSFE